MPQEKWLRRPIIDPLLIVLKSRRMIVALSALLVGLLTLAVPELEPLRAEILTLVITLALAVIGGYTVEDAARAGRERATANQDQVRELVKDVLTGLVDEFAKQHQSKQALPEVKQSEEHEPHVPA